MFENDLKEANRLANVLLSSMSMLESDLKEANRLANDHREQIKHLQSLQARQTTPFTGEPAEHSDTATSQQPHSREGLELSVELEHARQQIITLHQVLSRCYFRNFLNLFSLFLIDAIRPGAGAQDSTNGASFGRA